MKLLSWTPRSSRAPADGPPSVVLIERDPYLAFLIRLHVPEAHVIEADAQISLEGVRQLDPDLVVAGASGSTVPLEELVNGGGVPKVLAVVDGGRPAGGVIPPAVTGVLARPFAPTEVSHAVRTALSLGPREEDDSEGGPRLARWRAITSPARIAALALTAVLEIASTQVAPSRGYILGLAFAYATVRWVWRRPSLIADAADVGVATILVAVTGGMASNYLPFAAVIAGGAGLARGPRWGMLSGLVIVVGSTPLVYSALGRGTSSGREAASWAILFPLLGLTGGYAAHLSRRPAGEGLDVLVEANRVLSSLYRIARTLPGGLEIGSVADATMHELRDALGARAGAMLVAEAGSFSVVGSFGLADPTGVQVRDPAAGLGAAIYGERPILKLADVHPATAEALGDHDCWLAAPMRRGGIAHGLLLASCEDHRRHQQNGLLLRRLAEEATVAIENARLFSRVREISIDEERRRLARELHDGIAQSLTHLRYELDFIGRHGQAPDGVRKDLLRLGRVVDRTSNEVRSMILGLRAAVAAEGLVGSLRSFLGDLGRLDGPAIVFDARGEVRLASDVEGEIFRVAQEAVSNAIRHAQATRIFVRLEQGATSVRLMVEDDGIGIDRKRARRGGVGLDAMRERAELIGGSLAVEPRLPHGTKVVLEYTIKGEH